MTTDDAVEFVARTIHEKCPDRWTPQEARAMVELARETISVNPQEFVDAFLDNLAVLSENAQSAYREART